MREHRERRQRVEQRVTITPEEAHRRQRRRRQEDTEGVRHARQRQDLAKARSTASRRVAAELPRLAANPSRCPPCGRLDEAPPARPRRPCRPGQTFVNGRGQGGGGLRRRCRAEARLPGSGVLGERLARNGARNVTARSCCAATTAGRCARAQASSLAPAPGRSQSAAVASSYARSTSANLNS